MQLSTTVFSTVFLAAAALAADDATGPVSVALYSDGNCAQRVRTVSLSNKQCVNYAPGFSSAKVVGNPQVAIIDVYAQSACAGQLDRGYLANNLSACLNDISDGPSHSLVLLTGN